MGMSESRSAWLIGVLAVLAVLTAALVEMFGLADRPATEPPRRAVDHLYAEAVTVEWPGGKGVYLRWCDPAGYRVFAQAFESDSPIVPVKDDRCRDAH